MDKPRLAVGKRLAQVHQMSRAVLNPALLPLSSVPNYLLLSTKSGWWGVPVYVWAIIPGNVAHDIHH